MRRMTHWRPAFAVASIVAAAACVDTAGTVAQACSPGQIVLCACPNGGQGTQTCTSDGAGFGACIPCAGGQADGGANDGGSDGGADAGTDGGSADGGQDSGPTDGGISDGGDGGSDGGADDGGSDGGQPSCESPFVYLKDKRFWLGNQPFVPVSVNYGFDIRYVSGADGGKSYFIAPLSSFCRVPVGCCDDPVSCRAAVQAQLAQVRSLGVNSLRIVGLAAVPEGGDLLLECGWQRLPDWIDYCPPEGKLVVTRPADLAAALQLIGDALSLVGEAGLKAVLLAGHGHVDADEIPDGGVPAAGPIRAQYAGYLAALAARFADQPAVFAYDLSNEPVYEFVNTSIDKADANAIGRAWYDAVRAGTKKQMVTMGLAEIGTVRHWDPGALPLDFTSFHLYGSAAFSQADRDFLATSYAWLGQEPFPNLVGETGVSVGDGGVTEAEQQAFAQFSLDTAWACGALGLQWWIYRDTAWSANDYFGLVRQDGTVRPAAGPFGTFVPVLPRPACAPPAYEGSSPGAAFHTRGRLVRENGTPVANGFVNGHKCFTGGYDWTLSNADGTFDLRSAWPIHELEVTAPGLSLETKDAACGLASDQGDITLRALPLSMAISPPSSCP
jgi:hypothetical protein